MSSPAQDVGLGLGLIDHRQLRHTTVRRSSPFPDLDDVIEDDRQYDIQGDLTGASTVATAGSSTGPSTPSDVTSRDEVLEYERDQIDNFSRAKPEELRCYINIWKDGFSIGDGPLRRFEDPEHANDWSMIQADRNPLHLLGLPPDSKARLEFVKCYRIGYFPAPALASPSVTTSVHTEDAEHSYVTVDEHDLIGMLDACTLVFENDARDAKERIDKKISQELNKLAETKRAVINNFKIFLDANKKCAKCHTIHAHNSTIRTEPFFDRLKTVLSIGGASGNPAVGAGFKDRDSWTDWRKTLVGERYFQEMEGFLAELQKCPVRTGY